MCKVAVQLWNWFAICAMQFQNCTNFQTVWNIYTRSGRLRSLFKISVYHWAMSLFVEYLTYSISLFIVCLCLNVCLFDILFTICRWVYLSFIFLDIFIYHLSTSSSYQFSVCQFINRLLRYLLSSQPNAVFLSKQTRISTPKAQQHHAQQRKRVLKPSSYGKERTTHSALQAISCQERRHTHTHTHTFTTPFRSMRMRVFHFEVHSCSQWLAHLPSCLLNHHPSLSLKL